MRRLLAAAAALLFVAGTTIALTPKEIVATKTVGHQARAQRIRAIDRKPKVEEPRVCEEGEVSTDRAPCIGANGRVHYSR